MVSMILLEEEEKSQNQKMLSENFNVKTPSLSNQELAAELSLTQEPTE